MRALDTVSKREVAAFVVALLFFAFSLAVFVGGLPHPHLFQMIIANLSLMAGGCISVVTSIFGANRQWRLRTAS